MPSIIQKARDAVMAVSIGIFSSDHASASDAPDTNREPEAEPFVFQSQDALNKELYFSEDKHPQDDAQEIDWSVTRFLPPEPPLDERDCSLLSKHFQTTYCLQQENDAALWMKGGSSDYLKAGIMTNHYLMHLIVADLSFQKLP